MTSARILGLAGSLLLALVLVAGPAGATEAGTGTEQPTTEATATDAAESAPAPADESGRVSLPQRPHDRVGLLVLGLLGVGAAAALHNARKQLKGERPKATGEFRWR